MADIVVIGGGASGLAAADAAARAGAQVTIVESAERVGKPILATGNGRCNLSNATLQPADYNNPVFVTPALEAMPPSELRLWFEDRGLVTRAEPDGRVYPLSNTATSVVDVLRASCARAGVKERCGHAVTRIERASAFTLTLDDGSALDADAVIVACGGGSRLLATCGHELGEEQPVLCSLATETKPLRGLSGLRVEAGVRVLRGKQRKEVFAEVGEVLFRDYGLSGIVVFNASRFARKGDLVSLDLLPQLSPELLVKAMLDRQSTLFAEAERFDCALPTYEDIMRGLLHSRVSSAVLRATGVKPGNVVHPQRLIDVCEKLKDFRVAVDGVGDAKHAQVTRGGAKLSEFNAATLESKRVAGLFACGECLDIDGPCGGYNLHWAWASGITAGTHAARR